MRTHLVAVLLGLAIPSLSHAAEPIAFSTTQITRLGIELAALQDVETVFSRRLPARVVIPPSQERVVSAPQAGLIVKLHVAQGDVVKKGQVLAVIESPQLLSLQRDFLEASTRRRLARAELTRDQRLYSEGIIAQRRLLETRARFEEQDSALSEKHQALSLSGLSDKAIATLKRKRKLTSTLTLSAPIDGVVLEDMSAVGRRVQAADGLYRVAGLDTLWLAIRVPVEELSSVAKNADVKIMGCEDTWASLSVIGSAVNEQDQSVLVRAQTRTPSNCLRPGQFVEVRLSQDSPDARMHRVPSSAVVHGDGRTMVFVRKLNGFEALPVTVVSEDDQGTVIRATLIGNERIARTGLSAIKAAWLGMGGGE